MAQASFKNLLLSHMSAGDFGFIRPSLELVSTERLQVIIEPDEAIEFTYFMETGQASIIGVGHGREDIEVGIVGYEGATGLPLFATTESSPLKSMIQVPGEAWRISSDTLRSAMAASPTLREHLNLFTRYLYVVASFTAVSHGGYSVSERLARWLLMSHDRTDGDELHFIHEFLSIMLCVRRAGVTTAMHVLEGDGAVKATRGVITVQDREKLKEIAAGSYGPPEREYEKLFGVSFAKP